MKHLKKILTLALAFILVMSLSTSVFADNLDDEIQTATSAKKKAIVIIPGILGSSLETTSGQEVWLHLTNFGKMALNEEGESVYDIRSANYDNYGANNTYKTLYNSLNNAFGDNFDVIFFDYDFRLPNARSATKLQTELSGYSEVVLVAHSMGGLVAGYFLASSAVNRQKTTALITLGTPFVGAAKCINVMETGEMITFNLLGLNFNLFKDTIKDMSKNCCAAYQLLPTSNYYSITGLYPLSVNGTNYASVRNQLEKTAWGKRSNGTTKPMFLTATVFHSSLFNGTTHITDYNDVNVYTIAENGEDTISKVSMDSNYKITALTYSNSGDGTVLYKSAGYGTPDYTYTGTNHTGMVSDSKVISRIKSIITSETGVAATSVPFAEMSADENNIVYTSESTEIVADNLTINERGWIDGFDNRRINIYADNDSVLLVNGLAAIEDNERVFDQNGVRIGSVWEIGSTGRKMYALYNGEYELSGTGFLKIEYMDSGYFDSIEEYNLGVNTQSVSIGDYTTQLVTCRLGDGQMASEVEIQPIHTYSAAELMELNRD